MSKEKGKIVKGIGGFYYVETAGAVYECKARGNFRNQKLIPLVGDNVEISVNENSENRIESIFPRKNSLVRPPLANLDTLFIVSSIIDPVINTFNIDKMTALAEYKNINPLSFLPKRIWNRITANMKRYIKMQDLMFIASQSL